MASLEEKEYQEKLKTVLDLITNSGKTRYEISKMSGVTQASLGFIIKRTTKRPNERTLDQIIEAFQNKTTDMKIREKFSFEDLSDFLINNEEEFNQVPLFRIWLKEKISSGIVKHIETQKR